jgi:ADP-heptose:LPS heptosyltransferase
VGFARVADHLCERYGYAVAIAGSAADRGLAQRIVSMAKRAAPIDLTGRTPLPELVGLIAQAKILVSNETSAVHMAAAVGTRAVCISNGHQFGRFSPYPAQACAEVRYLYPREITERLDDMAGLCADYARRSYLDINEIPAGAVIEEIDAVLSENEAKVTA